MSTVVTDALGNELAEGELVLLKLGNDNVIGKIIQLRKGGIDIPDGKTGKITQTKGMVLIGFQVPIMLDPAPVVRIGALYRVVDPAQQGAVAEMMDNDSRAKSMPTIVP